MYTCIHHTHGIFKYVIFLLKLNLLLKALNMEKIENKREKTCLGYLFFFFFHTEKLMSKLRPEENVKGMVGPYSKWDKPVLVCYVCLWSTKMNSIVGVDMERTIETH